LASEQRSLIISAESRLGQSSPPHDEPPTVSQQSVVPKCCPCRVPTLMLIQVIATF
jgi:hypothetical protein